MFAILSLVAFWIGWQGNDANLSIGQSMAFMVLATSQVIQSYNMRSDRSLFKIGPFTNKTLNISALISLLLVAIVLFTPIGIPFGLEILSSTQYLICAGLIIVPLIVMELSKLLGLIKTKH
jgi:Ca2+-transporting ATPase